MPIAPVTLKLRSNDLSAGLRKLVEFGPRGAAHVANKAVRSIAINAHKSMPKVLAATIASDMNAVGFARNAKDKGWRKTNNERRDLTAAERIVLASIHPNSKFNLRTGGVFARKAPIFSSPSPGGGGRLTSRKGYKLGAQNRLRFWAWVEARAEFMVRARKSSGGFYKLGAAVIKLIFSKNRVPVRVPPGMLTGGEASTQPGDGKVGKAIGRVAGGTLATPGNPTAKFWVSTPEPDSKGSQEGITKVLQPVWQSAVDAEAAAIHKYAEELYARAIREAGFTVK